MCVSVLLKLNKFRLSMVPSEVDLQQNCASCAKGRKNYPFLQMLGAPRKGVHSIVSMRLGRENDSPLLAQPSTRSRETPGIHAAFPSDLLPPQPEDEGANVFTIY